MLLAVSYVENITILLMNGSICVGDPLKEFKKVHNYLHSFDLSQQISIIIVYLLHVTCNNRFSCELEMVEQGCICKTIKAFTLSREISKRCNYNNL